jgi:nitrate reductase NapE component
MHRVERATAFMANVAQVAGLLLAIYLAYQAPSAPMSVASTAPTPLVVDESSTSRITRNELRYFIVAIFGLWSLHLVAVIGVKRAWGKGPFLRGQLILGSGSGPDATIQTLNGAAVSDFRRHYNVAVICGLRDSTIDKFDDERISKSATFKIIQDEMEIVIPYQPPMTEALNKAIARMRLQSGIDQKPGFRQRKRAKKGLRVMQYQIQTWTEAVLLPKGADVTSIRRLSDVPKNGGLILSEEVREGRITPTV